MLFFVFESSLKRFFHLNSKMNNPSIVQLRYFRVFSLNLLMKWNRLPSFIRLRNFVSRFRVRFQCVFPFEDKSVDCVFHFFSQPFHLLVANGHAIQYIE